MINAMMIDAKDDVVIAIEEIRKGDAVNYLQDGSTVSFPAQESITIFHKVARRAVKNGSPVCKYGEHIGIASGDIQTGQHVHCHNIADHRENLDG